MNSTEPRPSALAWTLLALALLVAWDSSSLDLALAHRFGNESGFALRDQWWLNAVLHTTAKWAAWALEAALVASIWWPIGPLRRLAMPQRAQLALTTLVCLLAISGLKSFSLTSCPWELADFGGTAHYVSHWSWGVGDGGHGRCFPAGHASTGFAFVGGYFAWRQTSASTARLWLAGALVFGLVLGAGQQMRGAHFMSHTLWTAWLCWTTAWLADRAKQQWFPAVESPGAAALAGPDALPGA
jgi:membrane-associated PAP2 superfamily phosphatase